MPNSKMNGRGFRVDHTVKIDQVPKWIEQESSIEFLITNDRALIGGESSFNDPLSSPVGESADCELPSKFPVDNDINSKLYLWRGPPWSLEVDAVVNSTNEHLDEAASSPGMHAAAGPGLAEECAIVASSLGLCKVGETRVTSAYDLPSRRVFHTVGPKYNVKFSTAAENALSHCYRACLELLIENDLKSMAFGCIYTEAKAFPREMGAHIAIRTVRRFLEKHSHKVEALVMCTATAQDTEIYRRLIPLYFPRDKAEEDAARTKLPSDTGDEIGETVVGERKIRIQALPGIQRLSSPSVPPPRGLPVSNFARSQSGLRSESLEALVDPVFMAMMRDPDQRRQEQWERAALAQAGWGWARLIGLGGLGGPPLTSAEEDSLHSRFLARALSSDLHEIAEMKILYRGGRDIEGRQVMVVVGAHFVLRAMDPDRFVLYAVKEFESLTQRPYSLVYFHSDAHLPLNPNFGWMKRLQQALGRKYRHNLQTIYVLHPTVGLKVAIAGLQVLVDGEVWRKVQYVERLLDLFRYVPRENLSVPEFVLQRDVEVNPQDVVGLDTRQRQDRRRLRGPP